MLSPDTLKKGLRYNVIEIGFAAVKDAFTTGAILTGFVLFLGANNFLIGLLTALPSVTCLATPLASIITERTGHRKSFSVWMLALSRYMWLPIMAIPLIFPNSNSGLRIWLFLGLFLIASLFASLFNPPWSSWLADLIPENIRGKHFAKRLFLYNAVIFIAVPLGGKYLDLWPKSDSTGFVTLFGLAVIFAIISTSLVRKMPDLPMDSNREKFSFFEIIRYALRDQNFRRLMLFSGTLSFGDGLAGMFFIVYMLRVLKMSYAQVGMLGSLMILIQMPLIFWWGWLSDRYGHKPILSICLKVVMFTPILWLFVPLQNFWPMLLFIHILAGIFWAGVSLAHPNLIMRLVPLKNRSAYFSTQMVFVSVCVMLGSLFSGTFMSLVNREINIPYAGISVSNFHFLFLMISCVRFYAGLRLGRVNEPASEPTDKVIKMIPVILQSNFTSGFNLLTHYVMLPIQDVKRIIGYQDNDDRNSPNSSPG